jgi:hypothetical protein
VSQHQWLDGIEDGRDSYHQSPHEIPVAPFNLVWKGESLSNDAPLDDKAIRL